MGKHPFLFLLSWSRISFHRRRCAETLRLSLPPSPTYNRNVRYTAIIPGITMIFESHTANTGDQTYGRGGTFGVRKLWFVVVSTSDLSWRLDDIAIWDLGNLFGRLSGEGQIKHDTAITVRQSESLDSTFDIRTGGIRAGLMINYFMMTAPALGSRHNIQDMGWIYS